MSLKLAIEQIEAELPQTALREGTTDWWAARARAVGLSMLRRINSLGLEDRPLAGGELYQRTLRFLKEEDFLTPSVELSRASLENLLAALAALVDNQGQPVAIPPEQAFTRVILEQLPREQGRSTA